jgi:hypothetical protein
MKKWVFVAAAILFLIPSGRAGAADDLSAAAGRIHAGVAAVLKGIGGDIRAAADEAGKLGAGKEAEVRALLRGLLSNRPYAIDATFIDAKGVMRIIEPKAYGKYEGSDISKQEAVILMRKTKKPRMGKLFDSVEGIKSVDIECPVFGSGKKFLGSLSILINQAELVRGVAAPVERERGVNCWVMQRDGVIVYETDPAQLGLNTFRDPLYRDYPELIALGKRMVKERTGTGTYTFLLHGGAKAVEKKAAWKTIDFMNNRWIVVAYREVK